MTVPCWSQREETGTNEERREVKERERQKQIERKIPAGRAALSLSELVKFLAEDYTHIYTQAESTGICIVFYFLFFLFFFPSSSFLLALSCLSVSGGRWHEEEEEGFHCVSTEPLFQSS